MAGTADGEPDIDDLREDLAFEIAFLLGDLKVLGYDMNHVQHFLQETRALDSKTTEADCPPAENALD
jgi:hypothetical protein